VEQRPSTFGTRENGELGGLEFNDAWKGRFSLRRAFQINRSEGCLEAELPRREEKIFRPGGRRETQLMNQMLGLRRLAVQARNDG
jgi:hypothetical protein